MQPMGSRGTAGPVVAAVQGVRAEEDLKVQAVGLWPVASGQCVLKSEGSL